MTNQRIEQAKPAAPHVSREPGTGRTARPAVTLGEKPSRSAQLWVRIWKTLREAFELVEVATEIEWEAKQ